MTTSVLSKQALLEHWQGHRNLTRRVILAFPEKELFEYAVGGMRPFALLVQEMIAIAGPALKSIVNNETNAYQEADGIKTKEALLTKWDEETAVINHYYNLLSEERFQETFNLFGQYEFKIIDNIFYFIDNEIHHRGQGYVYLRSLGIEPPYFWER
ncbi:DinB family protein [Myroides ceti]|uniref:DinB family protein n=1 Tax=Paenimyroides ceti TaxID=395087 RepID=A0ABT8CYP2_9FLAO|nr:DinB family protein [Paenimyroides ceti]MDN3708687.1 DinB family protein [Paenimyroides ceti]